MSVDSVTCQPSKCSLIRLKHPRSGRTSFLWIDLGLVTFLDLPCLYLWDGQSSELFEIQKIDEKCRSWMLGENIKSGIYICIFVIWRHVDGGMYVCNRIDPLFFFISFCRKNVCLLTLENYISRTSLFHGMLFWVKLVDVSMSSATFPTWKVVLKKFVTKGVSLYSHHESWPSLKNCSS